MTAFVLDAKKRNRWHERALREFRDECRYWRVNWMEGLFVVMFLGVLFLAAWW